ncbi:MAG: hypothetical protein PHH28_07960 [Desulfuromonadaceae bacterium]|nr:hypothetical protein [Desulfuromonadaceae bacterium]
MSLELQDGRWSMLWRYNDKSLEIATQLLAFSRMSVIDRGVFWHLKIRWNIQIENLMHEFCYSVRKAIELTAKVQPEVSETAKNTFPHENGGVAQTDINEQVTLCRKSFLWIINRIIHSRDTYVKDYSVDVYVSPTPPHQMTSTFSPRYFGFYSDLDEHNSFQFVSIEELLQCFLGHIEPLIQVELEKWRENPLYL